MASQISRKYDFKPGTKIYSGQIDEELNQLVDAHNSVVNDKADKVNVLTLDNTIEFVPTEDYQPASKKYVDTTVGSVVLGQIPDKSITKAKLTDTLQNEILYVTNGEGKKYKVSIKKDNILYPYFQKNNMGLYDLFAYPDSQTTGNDTYNTKMDNRAVTNGTEALFVYIGNPGTHYFGVAHYSPVTGITCLSIPSIGTTGVYGMMITKSKTDNDLAYVMVLDDNASTNCTLFVIRISTGEIVSNTQITNKPPASASHLNLFIDLGDILVTGVYTSSTNLSVDYITKSTVTCGTRNLAISGQSLRMGFGNNYGLFMWPDTTNKKLKFCAIKPLTGETLTVLSVDESAYIHSYPMRSCAIFDNVSNKWFIYIATADNTYSIYTWDESTLVTLDTNVSIPTDNRLYHDVNTEWSSTITYNDLLYVFRKTKILVISKSNGHIVKTIETPPLSSYGTVYNGGNFIYILGASNTYLYNMDDDSFIGLSFDSMDSFNIGKSTFILNPALVEDGSLLVVLRAYPGIGFPAPMSTKSIILKFNPNRICRGICSLEEVIE